MRSLRSLTLVVAALVLALAAARAEAQCSGPFRVEQAFPTSGPEQTRWLVCWQMMPGPGLVITSAFFRKSPSSPWMRVLWEGRVAEIFVVYDNGTRFYDVTTSNQPHDPLSLADCPPSIGQLLGPPPGANQVCQEVRDRGISWRKSLGTGTLVRRGEEVALWGVLKISNYQYMQEWIFRDDGVLEARVGATGNNFPSFPWDGHTHDVTWRLDVDLDGASGDSVYTGTYDSSKFSKYASHGSSIWPREGAAVWRPEKFESWEIGDASLKNSRGERSQYHLMPTRWGNARHRESETHWDFWVTRYNTNQYWPRHLHSYTSNRESVVNTDVVLWYTSAFYHHPRAEDGFRSLEKGATPAMWATVMLKPYNLFDSTPLYP